MWRLPPAYTPDLCSAPSYVASSPAQKGGACVSRVMRLLQPALLVIPITDICTVGLAHLLSFFHILIRGAGGLPTWPSARLNAPSAMPDIQRSLDRRASRNRFCGIPYEAKLASKQASGDRKLCFSPPPVSWVLALTLDRRPIRARQSNRTSI